MRFSEIYRTIIMLLLVVSANAQYTTYDQIYHTDEYGMQSGYSTTRDFGFQEQTTYTREFTNEDSFDITITN